MIVILFFTMVLGAKLKGLGLLGLFGGLLGSLFSYICFTSENLVLNTTYDQTAQIFVYQTYPMSWFAWIPLILVAANFIVALDRK